MPTFGAQKDLVDSIERGDFPSWAVKVQIMTEAQAKTYAINPFDLTKIWPHADFPLIEIGQLELNRNVTNYFAETEQPHSAPVTWYPVSAPPPTKCCKRACWPTVSPSLSGGSERESGAGQLAPLPGSPLPARWLGCPRRSAAITTRAAA